MNLNETLSHDALYKLALWQALWSGKVIELERNVSANTNVESDYCSKMYSTPLSCSCSDNGINRSINDLKVMRHVRHGLKLLKEGLPRRHMFAPCCVSEQCNRGSILSGFALHNRLRAGRSEVYIDSTTGISDEECYCLAHSLAPLSCEDSGLVLKISKYKAASSVFTTLPHSLSSPFTSRTHEPFENGLRCLLCHTHWREICIRDIALASDCHAMLTELSHYFAHSSHSVVQRCSELHLINVSVVTAFSRLLSALILSDVLRELELQNVGITSINELVTYVRSSKKLSALTLTQFDKNCEWGKLASAVAGNASLTELRLRNSGWDNASIYHFLCALGDFHSRPHFKLEIISDGTFDLNTLHIVSCAASDALINNLTGFVLGYFTFSVNSSQPLTEQSELSEGDNCNKFSVSHKNESEYKIEDMYNTCISNNNNILITFCNTFYKLEEFVLIGQDFNEKRSILNNSIDQRKQQSMLKEREEREQSTLIRALCSNSARAWKQIGLSKLNLNAATLKRLSHLHFSLNATLNLSENNLHEHIGKMNFSAFLANLRVLDLSFCHLQDDDITVFGNVLEKCAPLPLEVLRLKGNYFSNCSKERKNAYGQNDNAPAATYATCVNYECDARNSIINSVSRNYNKGSVYTSDDYLKNNNHINDNSCREGKSCSTRGRGEKKGKSSNSSSSNNSNFLYLSRAFRESCLPKLIYLDLAWNDLPLQPMLTFINQVSKSLQILDISFSSIANQSNSVELMLNAIKQRQVNASVAANNKNEHNETHNSNVSTDHCVTKTDVSNKKKVNFKEASSCTKNADRFFTYLDFYCRSIDDHCAIFLPREMTEWLTSQCAISVYARFQS